MLLDLTEEAVQEHQHNINSCKRGYRDPQQAGGRQTSGVILRGLAREQREARRRQRAGFGCCPGAAGCAGEGRGCLCHRTDHPHPTRGLDTRLGTLTPRTPNPGEQTAGANAPFPHPFPSSHYLLPALLSFPRVPKEDEARSCCVGAGKRDSSRRAQPLWGRTQPARCRHLSLKSQRQTCCLPLLSLEHWWEVGALPPSPPVSSPLPLLCRSRSPHPYTKPGWQRGSSLLLLVPFPPGLLSPAVPGRGGMEGGEEAFGSVPPLITCA